MSSFHPRPHAGLLWAVMIPLIFGSAATSHAVDAPLAVVQGEPVTQKDVSDAAAGSYQDTILNHLILERLVDAAAKKAGVSVTPAEVDSALKSWKDDRFNGDENAYEAALMQDGMSPTLYSDVLRVQMLAQRVVTATTHLDDDDYDQVLVQRLAIHTRKDAEQVFAWLTAGWDILDIQRKNHVNVELLTATWFSRWDNRIPPEALAPLFKLKPTEFMRPVPQPDGPGYEILILQQHRSGAAVPPSDRQVAAVSLLPGKIRASLQEWWVALQKQVAEARAAGAAGATGAPAH
jgi:hypothetical protein